MGEHARDRRGRRKLHDIFDRLNNVSELFNNINSFYDVRVHNFRKLLNVNDRINAPSKATKRK